MHPLAAHLLKIIGVALAGLLAVVGIPLLGLAFFFSGTEDLCGNSPVLEVPSPSGNWKAVVFERNCGATTGFSTQVSVLGAKNSLPNEGGNLFVADTNQNAAPSGPGGGPAVRVTWHGSSSLRIEHHPLARVRRSEPSVNGVHVEYLPTRSDG